MLRVDVKTDLLRWARERSGNTIDTLIARFPKLSAWESGTDKPTLKQLEAYAKATHTPIGFLFLQQPPSERIPIADFRTIAGVRFARPSPDLLETIYLCQHRQDWYRDFARTSAQPHLTFVGSARCTDDVVEVAASIRNTLGLDVEERRRLRTWEEALRRLAERADEIGVLVMVSGIVGSNTHRTLDPEEFRGFAITDPRAPLVFVNGADTKAAQMFTLAHELAHLWIGETGVSDTDASELPGQEIERWCNQVAAELLVPLESVRREHRPKAPLIDEAQRLARTFKVSTLVALRRIRDTGAIDQKMFWAAYRSEQSRLVALPKSKSSGGDFFATLGVRVGKSLAHALVVSALEGRTTFTEAFRLLGISKLSTFDTLAERLGVDPS
ncbi:MAG: XRE family transcriptional regulator [Planctomycetes bacterium]|jgi:Zn-dependent peptidase ImmA (M78 family)|nr:XRE family transcriptional regulator [Planctomycetota bacterium]